MTRKPAYQEIPKEAAEQIAKSISKNDNTDGDTDGHLSRREFLRGSMKAGLAGGVALASASSAVLLSACAPTDEDSSTGMLSEGRESDGIETLSVPTGKVVLAQDFETLPHTGYLNLQGTFDLPVGSTVHQVDSNTLLVLVPSAENLNAHELAFLDLASGAITTIVKKPIGTTKTTAIYDARASASRLAWVELDLSNYSWCVYMVPLTNKQPGEALLIDEGNVDYEPPMLAVYMDKIYWTHMPMAEGNANQENSFLRAIEFEAGANAADTKIVNVLVSPGRMATNPSISEGVITVVPRVNTDLVYYELTALDCANDRRLDSVIMPPSLRVSEAFYLQERFGFCIERNYAYAGGLSNFGTYFQIDNDEYLHFSRTPMSSVVMFKNHLMIKSTANIVGVDIANRKTFIIDTPPQCSDFGEALVGTGMQDKVITSSIRLSADRSVSEAVMVRVFA